MNIYLGNQIHSVTMRSYIFIAFSSILVQISSAFLPRDMSDEVYKTNPLPTESDLSLNEDLSMWGLETETDFAPIPKEPDGIELDQDPMFSSDLTADSELSSCPKSDEQNSKIRKRGSELCPKDQADPPPKEAESLNRDEPDVFDPTEKDSLQFSMPALDLNINRPMCTYKKYLKHLCCDGPTGPWVAQGPWVPECYFGSVDKCWPCTSF